MGASKAKLWLKCFLIYVQMDGIEEPPRTFYLDGCIFHIEQTNENQSNRVDHSEETKVMVLKIQQNLITHGLLPMDYLKM